MKAVTIRINGVSPISTNEMYYSGVGRGGKSYRTRTSGYNQYRDLVTEVLRSILELSKDHESIIRGIISEAANPSNSSVFGVVTYLDREVFWTQSGDVRSMDSSNFLKPVEDAWINSCDELLEGAEYDDKYHRTTFSKKLPSDESFQEFTIWVSTYMEDKSHHVYEVDYEWYEVPPVGRQRKPRTYCRVTKVDYSVMEDDSLDNLKEMITSD